MELLGGLHRNIDISKWPKNDVLKYWSAKENWKDGQSGYALAKLLQQYAVNEIAKLALSADGKYAMFPSRPPLEFVIK